MTVALDHPNVFDAGLPVLDYEHARHPSEAHDIIARARAQSPIAMGVHGPELLTYELVHAALRDPRFEVPPGMFLAAQGITSGPVWDRVVANLISLDGTAHRRLRRLVAPAFTPRASARLRTTVVDTITGLVDQHHDRGHCDVVTDIARHYPVPIICALLGAPPEDAGLFADWVEDIMKVFGWGVAEHLPAILSAWEALDAYVDDMIARRRHTLTDDLISDLIRAEEDGDRLCGDELRMLVAGVLMGGTDTTRNQLAASVHVLCEHPDQWALLGRRPDLAAPAVAETLRHTPVAFATVRITITDVEYAGLVIPAGTVVTINTAAANRDPAVYDDPDRLDITRTGAAPVMTFGGGMHYCLGSHLARLELTEALTVMPQRLPNARLAGPAPWKPLTALSGPATLPIEFSRFTNDEERR
ncbi:cytochrome P450 [Mycolicibacter senuensis]|uniref:cytochrome P450 n=1 Tax=Mycolicibacter senuensis TaxID=386913 RepID=UPI000DCF3C2E|nr:cytochrome P450 [Mycolicibacter senuensis]RAU91291.1 cytochrome P450 [Mycolicibacter senuensis]